MTRDKGENVVKGRVLLKHHGRQGDLQLRKRLIQHSAFISISSKSYQTSLSRVQSQTSGYQGAFRKT